MSEGEGAERESSHRMNKVVAGGPSKLGLGGASYCSVAAPVKSTLVDFASTKVDKNVPTGTLGAAALSRFCLVPKTRQRI